MTIHESILDGLADIRSHRVRTFLQTLGVMLGVGSLVAVQGLVDAGRRQAVDFFSEMGGLTKILVVNRPPKEVSLSARQLAATGLTWDDALAIRHEVTHAAQVDPIATTRLNIRYGDHNRTRGIMAATADYQFVYKHFPVEGRFLTEDDIRSQTRVCVLGDTAARWYFGNENPVGKILYIGDVGFLVVGLLEKKEFYFREGDENALEWMNRVTIIPLTSLYSRFTGDTDKKVQYINVVVDKVENNSKVAEDIRGILQRQHGGILDFEVYNRDERLRAAVERNRTFDILFMATGIVALIVGGIVIMNIMLASYQERIREVGIRKSVGAKGSDIAVQFLVESILVTSIGGAVGLFVGMLFAGQITRLIGAPAIITPRMAVVSVVTSVSVGLFFGLYPAMKAARLNPVEALRYE